VYYVQYAHARVASVLRQAGIEFHGAVKAVEGADLALLTSAYETALLCRLDEFPEEVAVAARELAPHRLTGWLKDLSQEFHSYYNAERFLVDDPAQRRARLALVVATGQVIRNGLALLGIAAPLEM
jgi:arginyl-tRNA synthetase